jgi:transcriptional regulator of met regulon
LEKNTETFTSKDTVKVGEKFVGRSKVPVYAKVTAKLTQIRKTVRSAGLLNMRITDFRTRQIVNQEKFNGEYNWTCEWAHFNGDERALSAAQLRKCKSQELLPPDPQQLFIEFSKPIYERLTSKLQTFYAKY